MLQGNDQLVSNEHYDCATYASFLFSFMFYFLPNSSWSDLILLEFVLMVELNFNNQKRMLLKKIEQFNLLTKKMNNKSTQFSEIYF